MTTVTLDHLRQVAALAGFQWSDAELEPLRLPLERALETFDRLEQLSLSEVEPVTQYRVI